MNKVELDICMGIKSEEVEKIVYVEEGNQIRFFRISCLSIYQQSGSHHLQVIVHVPTDFSSLCSHEFNICPSYHQASKIVKLGKQPSYMEFMRTKYFEVIIFLFLFS